MNLDAILKRDAVLADHSLVDHSWMQDSGLARDNDPILDISSLKNPNNIKPELEVEWGLGGPDVNLDEPAGVVERNIPEDKLGDADKVILFARDMMNRGFRGRQVVASLKKRYPSALLAEARDGLREMFALEGIVGRVVVDARGYKNCQAAVKATANNPYKRLLKCVVGCQCGDPHVLPMNDRGLFAGIEDSTGNGMDDFLGRETKKASKVVAHCRSTMLPILASAGDLDKSLLDSTMIEMMNVTSIPQSVVQKINASSSSNMEKLRAAFAWLDKQADFNEDQQYAEAVDNSDFIVQQADNEVELEGLGPDMLDVDGTNPALSTDIDYDGLGTTELGDIDSIPNVLDNVELDGVFDGEQIPVELMDERGSSVPVFIDDPMEVPETQEVEQAPVDLNVDFFSTGGMDVDLDGEQELPLDDEMEIFAPLDVDPQAGDMDATAPSLDIIDVNLDSAPPPEFEGVDEIELDDPSESPDELFVDMAPDQDIEL